MIGWRHCHSRREKNGSFLCNIMQKGFTIIRQRCVSPGLSIYLTTFAFIVFTRKRRLLGIEFIWRNYQKVNTWESHHTSKTNFRNNCEGVLTSKAIKALMVFINLAGKTFNCNVFWVVLKTKCDKWILL